MKLHRRKITFITYLFLGLIGTIGIIKAATSNIDKTLQELKIITSVFDHIQKSYVTDTKSQDLIYGAAHGMVRTLDPFSQFLEPEHHKDMKTETEGQFGGLGIRIQMRDGWLTVMTPIPNTPAYRAGILPGDRIVRIEEESTKGITLRKAVNKLRGKPGTKVTITIVHEGIKEPKDIEIVRQVIKIKSVRSRRLDDKIGYIQLIEFTAKTDIDMMKALDKMKKQGLEGLVLDLRYNPGGLLNVAVNVTKKFLSDNKLIVYTKGRRADRVEYRSDSTAPYADIPLVVLVNGGSASGSEIVAGALQDHKRALILGTTTFGKASVQSVIPLPGGSGLRLTTAKYYTPSGKLIQRDEKTGKGGIIPNIQILVPREIAIKIRRQQEEIYAKNKAPRSVISKENQAEDISLKRAMEYLKAGSILNRAKKT